MEENKIFYKEDQYGRYAEELAPVKIYEDGTVRMINSRLSMQCIDNLISNIKKGMDRQKIIYNLSHLHDPFDLDYLAKNDISIEALKGSKPMSTDPIDLLDLILKRIEFENAFR